MIDVALATCRRLAEPDPDAPLLCTALARVGIAAELMAWDDPAAAFDRARLTVLRSTWNYPHEPEAFLAWAAQRGERLCNPGDVVRWNAHKSYLKDLAAAGLAVVPTLLVERGTEVTLERTVTETDWSRLVVKPAVSAGSLHTRRLDRSDVAATEAWWQERLRERDMMVQPYLAQVEGYGERAVVTIAGEPTHAVRKAPRFAADEEQVSGAMPISAVERRFVEQVLGLAQARFPNRALLYGRIDLVPDAHGAPMLMELELIEPSLFFAQCLPALDRFVAAIEAWLGRR